MIISAVWFVVSFSKDTRLLLAFFFVHSEFIVRI